VGTPGEEHGMFVKKKNLGNSQGWVPGPVPFKTRRVHFAPADQRGGKNSDHRRYLWGKKAGQGGKKRLKGGK